MSERINVDEPLWDQSTFIGRFKHFLWVTDPRTVLVSDKKLDEAKELVDKYRKGHEPPGTTKEDIIYAKKLHEGAFHPDTDERQNVFGRMSFQVPGNTLITAAMIQWYKSNVAVIFWQWFNQSYMSLVNYTNRNATSELTKKQVFMAYIMATTSAITVALGCKQYWSKRASPLYQRFVPFVAVAAANCVNVPTMRQNEIINGIKCTDENGKFVGKSRLAAVKGISQVVISRITMAFPGMILLPIIVERLDCYCWFHIRPHLHGPFQLLAIGALLIIMTPFGCALFPQKCRIRTATVKQFEQGNFENMQKTYGANIPNYVYFNKGL